jgi:hypothetical protein
VPSMSRNSALIVTGGYFTRFKSTDTGEENQTDQCSETSDV